MNENFYRLCLKYEFLKTLIAFFIFVSIYFICYYSGFKTATFSVCLFTLIYLARKFQMISRIKDKYGII